VNEIREKTGSVVIANSAGVAIATFLSGQLAMGVGISSFPQSITAFAGGGQGSATSIISNVAYVTTVATTGDSVKLPEWIKDTVLFNNGANAFDLFPPSGGTINGGATNAAVSVAVGAKLLVTSVDGVAYTTTNLGAQCSSQSGVTAFATGGQANGTLVNSEVVTIATVGTTGDSLTISSRLRRFHIQNGGANDADLFPPVGGTINGGGANAAISIVAAKRYSAFSANGSRVIFDGSETVGLEPRHCTFSQKVRRPLINPFLADCATLPLPKTR